MLSSSPDWLQAAWDAYLHPSAAVQPGSQLAPDSIAIMAAMSVPQPAIFRAPESAAEPEARTAAPLCSAPALQPSALVCHSQSQVQGTVHLQLDLVF